MAQEYTRVNIRFTNEVISNLDIMCEKYGMARSNLIAYYVGKMLSAEMKAESMLSPELLETMIKLQIDNSKE